MKKTFLTIAVMFCSMATLFANIVTDPPSGIIHVGDNIGIRFDCADGNRINFYFGDGTSVLNVYPNTDLYQYHYYKNPGTYTLHKHLLPIVTPSCLYDEYRDIVVLENRTIIANPAAPKVGQSVTFTGNNFKTSANITWDMGDGTFFYNNKNIVSHAFTQPGTYIIKAFDWNGDMATTPVTLVLKIEAPIRAITYSPELPRVDQQVNIQAVNFRSDSIDWNFGDGSPMQTYSAQVAHRFDISGTFVITAKERGLDITPISRAITVLPENRSLVLSTPEARIDEPLTVTAQNFRGRLILWDFGDGTVVSGPATMTHTYKLPGNYIITALDENGISTKKIQVFVNILGINDQVNLEIAEISLDNGKYYKVIPKNSKNIKAQLKMKMRGTGIVSGYWIVNGQPYQFFNETVYQGQIKTIFTQDIPGLPVFDPGMHTITIQLTRPATESVIFPTLRYFVLPYDNTIEILTPRDGAIIKDDEIANFSWEETLGGSYYQIAFANSLFPLLQNDSGLNWSDCPDRLKYTPDADTWKSIRRNQWTYWKVRAMDSSKGIIAESNIQEIKVIIPGAKVGIQKITDMNGNNIAIGNSFTATKVDHLLIHGYLTYPGEAEYLILQVFANENKIDQLLFRDIKMEEKRFFETSVPNMDKESRIVFQVLKSSSPSVIIGFIEFKLKKE
jgi:PKD repeat protein